MVEIWMKFEGSLHRRDVLCTESNRNHSLTLRHFSLKMTSGRFWGSILGLSALFTEGRLSLIGHFHHVSDTCLRHIG